MNRPPVWVAGLAARFWADAGDPPPFPRDLAAAVAWLPTLHLVNLPHLTLGSAAEYLARYGRPFTPPGPDRRLRGLLYAGRGAGTIFLDAADDPAERRFTLAHEIAHFLRDHDEPRRLAARRFGPAVLEVLDGVRPPTALERLSAVFRGLPVGPHVHLLDRDERGRPASPAEREAEAAADRLAFELLAPFDAVAAAGPDNLADRLVATFGLPPAPAARYSALLSPPIPRGMFVPRPAQNR